MWFFRGYPPSPSHGFGAYKTPFVLLQFHWLYSRICLVRFGFIFALKLFVAVVKVVVMLNTAAYLNSKNNKESTQK